MKNTDLKKLNRTELLEMLVDLSEENETLRADNARLREQLQEQQINIEKAGSIAEAALALNGVFEAAQRAADQYLANVRRLHLPEEGKRKDEQAQ